jgi:hypothetical protein
MAHEQVQDDEIVLRHIPGGTSHQTPPHGRISSVNFRLRPGETGYSVSRAVLTTPDQLMARLGDPATGSRIAAARVADLRALGFDVVPVPLAGIDEGHAEIRATTVNPNDKPVQRALAALFQYV